MQELLQDINALRRGIEALNKRSLEQGKPVSRAELDEVLARVKQETRFVLNYEGIAEKIQPHLTTPAKVEAALATGIQQLVQAVNQIPRSVPVVGAVWGFTNWRLLLLVVVLLLSLGAFGGYVWSQKVEAKAELLRLQQRDTQREATLMWLSQGYLDLKKADPKTAEKYFSVKK